LKVHSQFQTRDQLYLYLALNPNSMTKTSRNQTLTTMSTSRLMDDDNLGGKSKKINENIYLILYD